MAVVLSTILLVVGDKGGARIRDVRAESAEIKNLHCGRQLHNIRLYFYP